MSESHGAEGPLHISHDKLFTLMRSLAGHDSGFEDPDRPLPPGPWDPLIRIALETSFRAGSVSAHMRGPHPEPWVFESETSALGRAILRMIAERYPAIWDVIGGGRRDPEAWVELNPQPLPPRAAFSRALVDAVVARAQLMHDVAGEERGIIIVGGYVGRFADDYCGNGFRIRWPFPGPPPPWFSEPVSGVDLLVAATQFDTAAKQSFNPDLRRAFSDAGGKLAGAGLSRLS